MNAEFDLHMTLVFYAENISTRETAACEHSSQTIFIERHAMSLPTRNGKTPDLTCMVPLVIVVIISLLVIL